MMTEQPDPGRNPGSTSRSIDPAFPAPTTSEGEVVRAPDPPPVSRAGGGRRGLGRGRRGRASRDCQPAGVVGRRARGVPVTVTVDGFTETVRSTRPEWPRC